MRIRKDRAHGPDARDAVHAARRDAPHDGRAPVRAAPDVAAGAATHDAELGRMFRNMRVAMKASREIVARRLAIAVPTIDSLEAGAVAAFPHWRETERIVRTYCELLRLDPEPILWRIRLGLQALAGLAPAPSHYPPPTVSYRAPAAEGRAPATSASSRRGRLGRPLLALGAPLALLAALTVGVELAAAPLYRGLALLPAALGAPLREGLDQLLLLTAPRHEGLRWVDIGDPRARKTDRLQPGAR